MEVEYNKDSTIKLLLYTFLQTLTNKNVVHKNIGLG